MKLAIVILNWNGISLLQEFIPKLVEYTKEHDLYVIDNASTDESVPYLESNYPEITIIHNTENYGFAKGYNVGLQNIEADIYCLLNSDVAVTENWCSPILKLFDDENIEAVQPKILSYKNPDEFEFAGAAGGFIDDLGFPYCRGRVFFDVEKDAQQYNDNTPIHWASGACLFIRKSTFDFHKGFDELYFAHMEEIDLCWRIRNTGKEIWYCSESTVYHVGGGTLHSNNPQKTFLNFRNNLLTLLKNLPPYSIYWIIPLRLVLDGLAGLRFLCTNGFGHFVAIIRAHFAFYALLPNYFSLRKPGLSKYYIHKGIVFQYFLFQKNTFNKLK